MSLRIECPRCCETQLGHCNARSSPPSRDLEDVANRVKMGGMKNEYAVNLKAEEQYHLRNLTKSVTLSVRALKRAQVLLEVDERVDGPGWSDAAIAEALEVASPDCVRHSQTISRTRAGIGSTGSIHRP